MRSYAATTSDTLPAHGCSVLAQEALGALAGMAAGAGGEEGGMIQVELTEEDMQKVERLQALGFQRDACIEALIACDHNEEMAANFLAEQMFDWWVRAGAGWVGGEGASRGVTGWCGDDRRSERSEAIWEHFT